MICRRRDLISFRDLNAIHLDLLENILESSTRFVKETFGLNRNQLKIFAHYQPSFYHFHIHIIHIGLFSTHSLRAVLLEDIIDNMKSDYYQSCSLTFSSSLSHPLTILYKQAKPELFSDK